MENKWADTANHLADIASDLAKQFFRKPLRPSFKIDGSSVSQADLVIEQAMRSYLETHHPRDGILGEEYHNRKSESGYTWVLDPIDGTNSFLSGKPSFCTLIALLQDDKPLLGLISQPILDERWLGIRGSRSLFNGEPIPKLAPPLENKIRFSSTTPQMFKTAEEICMYQKALAKSAICTYGGDAYAYGLLASGFIDLILEADLAFYDVAALVPIIEGVGGKITDWQGQAILQSTFKGQVLACRTLLNIL